MMIPMIGLETRFFLVSLVWGILILMSYDMVRIVRNIISHKWIVVAFEDILFWIICAIFIFAMMYKMNNGIIRGFSIMGMTIGMLFYNQLCSAIIVKELTALLKWINKKIKFIILLLIKPIRIVILRIKRIFLFVHKKLKKISKFSSKALKIRKKTVKILPKKK